MILCWPDCYWIESRRTLCVDISFSASFVLYKWQQPYKMEYQDRGSGSRTHAKKGSNALFGLLSARVLFSTNPMHPSFQLSWECQEAILSWFRPLSCAAGHSASQLLNVTAHNLSCWSHHDIVTHSWPMCKECLRSSSEVWQNYLT